jgi:hypothetical protein
VLEGKYRHVLQQEIHTLTEGFRHLVDLTDGEAAIGGLTAIHLFVQMIDAGLPLGEGALLPFYKEEFPSQVHTSQPDLFLDNWRQIQGLSVLYTLGW